MVGLISSLTRSFLQCHSLTIANDSWIKEFNVDQSFFHFGGGEFSNDENTGYFYGENKIMSLLKNGKLVNQWSNFTDFLNDKLTRSEKDMLKEVPKKINLIVTE